MESHSHEELIKFPRLLESYGSLTALEKIFLGNFILLARPRLIIELGVMNAVSTHFMCDFLAENKIDGAVVGFDLPEVIHKLRQSNEVVQYLEKDSRLQLVSGRLPESLMKWLNKSKICVDLALVDATHDYRSVMSELSLLWPILSPEGYILCHDYSSKYDGVRYAVDRFAARRGVMVLSLLSSERTRQAGYASELVVLCRRPYRPVLRRLLYHVWLATKSDLLLHPLLSQIWYRIRPWIR